jgi:hypothetical protein
VSHICRIVTCDVLERDAKQKNTDSRSGGQGQQREGRCRTLLDAIGKEKMRKETKKRLLSGDYVNCHYNQLVFIRRLRTHFIVHISIPALVFDGVDVNCDGLDEETYTHIRGQKRTKVAVI